MSWTSTVCCQTNYCQTRRKVFRRIAGGHFATQEFLPETRQKRARNALDTRMVLDLADLAASRRSKRVPPLSHSGNRGLPKYRDGNPATTHGILEYCHLADSAIITKSLTLATTMLNQMQEESHGSSNLLPASSVVYRGDIRGTYGFACRNYRVIGAASTVVGGENLLTS